jgi:hypothetical protein
MAMRLSRKRSDTFTLQTSALSQYARPFVVQRQGQEEAVGTAPEKGVSLLNNRYQVSATPKYQPGWIARAQADSQPKGLGVQAKLTIGQPNDRYEQEADRVAEQVMGMPDAKPVVQREGLPGEEEELQTKLLGGAIQREAMPEEEEEIQAMPLSATITPLVQREVMPEEEEEVQAKSLRGAIQREAVAEEEEEPIQGKLIQREAMGEEEEEIQAKRSSGGGFEAGGDFESRLGSSKSGGSPLPEDVRSFMEPRFGADFSGVRVHTGGEAVQMNREVGAQAFAHGQDVYYGAGKGPGKDTLTAHELTHVVQQTADTKQLPQRKNSSPDIIPREAIKKGINPQLRLTPTIQTYQQKFPVRDMGTSLFTPSIVEIYAYGTANATDLDSPPSPGFFDFTGGLIENIILSEGTSAGRVNLHLADITTISNMTINELHIGKWDGIVPFTVTSDQITFGGAIVNSETSGSGASMSVNVGSGSNPHGGYVTFTLTVNSSGSTGSETGGGVSVEPLGVGIESSHSRSTSSALAGGITRSFTVNIRSSPPRPIVGPDMSFRVNSSSLEEGQEGLVSQWFNNLSESNKDAIRNGRRAISISGYASTTGRRGRNRNLSEQRAHNVERILRGHVGSNAVLNIYFFGEDNATTPNEVEDQTWRRATVVVQAPNHTAPQTPGAAAR